MRSNVNIDMKIEHVTRHPGMEIAKRRPGLQRSWRIRLGGYKQIPLRGARKTSLLKPTANLQNPQPAWLETPVPQMPKVPLRRLQPTSAPAINMPVTEPPEPAPSRCPLESRQRALPLQINPI